MELQIENVSKGIRKVINKNIIILAVLIVLVSILLRVPLTPSEINYDSYIVHEMTMSVYSNDYSPYNNNVLSLFGLFPFSYASLNPYLVTILAKITNIGIDNIAIIYPIILGILGALLAFIFFYKLSSNRLHSLIFTIFFCFSVEFIYLTTYTIRSRALITLLLPLIFFIIYCYEKEKKRKYLVLLIIILFIALMSHRLGLFLIYLIIVYILFKASYPILKNYAGRNKIYAYITIIGLLTPYVFRIISLKDITSVLRLGLDIAPYLRSQNIIFIIAIVGFLYSIFYIKERSFMQEYILVGFIMLIPFFSLTVYMPELIVLFVSYFATNIIVLLVRKYKNINYYITGIILIYIACSIILSLYHPSLIIKSVTNANIKEYATNEELAVFRWAEINTEKKYLFISNNDFEIVRFNVYNYCRGLNTDRSFIGCNLITFKSDSFEMSKIHDTYSIRNPFFLSTRLSMQGTIKSIIQNNFNNFRLLYKYNIRYLLININSKYNSELIKKNNVIYSSNNLIILDSKSDTKKQ